MLTTGNALKSMAEHLKSIRDLIGNTPLVELPGSDNFHKLFAKLEFYNFVGSVKDRPAFDIIFQAIKRGEINQDTLVVESSSGNFASALALICSTLGLKFVAVIDPNTNNQIESFLNLHCYDVHKVTKRDSAGGYLKERLKTVKEICFHNKNSFWTNQYENIDSMNSHYNWLGKEICDQIESLDYIFVAVSSGGTIAGVSNRVKDEFPNATVIAVDVEGSVIFGQKAKKRCIPGVGSSIVPLLIDHAQIDRYFIVSEQDMIKGCHMLLNQYGLFLGGSSGCVYWAAINFLSKLDPKKRTNSVIICPDKGNNYLDNVYNLNWLERKHFDHFLKKKSA